MLLTTVSDVKSGMKTMKIEEKPGEARRKQKQKRGVAEVEQKQKKRKVEAEPQKKRSFCIELSLDCVHSDLTQIPCCDKFTEDLSTDKCCYNGLV